MMRSCLVFILLLSITGWSAAQSATLVQGLRDRVFPLREERVVVLFCEFKDASTILWSVNSTVISSLVYPPFTFTNAKALDNGIIRSNVSFALSQEVNDTEISCNGYGIDLMRVSSSAIITIAAVPLHPVPRLSIQDLHNLYVTWDAPFTWSAYPITNYSLSVVLSNEHSDTIVLPGGTLSHTFVLNYSVSSCINTTVFLTAQNEVGTSHSGIASQSLPAAPGEFAEELDVSVTFNKVDMPHVQVDFTFPKLCNNNYATYYFLRFYDEEGQEVYTSKEVAVSWHQGGMKTTIHVLNDAIKKDTIYEVVLYIRTAGGNKTASFEIETSRGINGSTGIGTNAGLNPVPSNNIIYIIVAVAGGLVVLLVITLIALVIAILSWRRTLKSRKRVCSENVLKKMIQNPVYDNQIEVIYDEIPVDGDKYPQTLSQGQEENDEGYTSVRSTPVQVVALPELKPENQDPEDPYTVMNSIGTVLPRLSLTDVSRTDDHAELSRTASRSKRPENQYHFK